MKNILPKCKNARIEPAKLYNYLLNLNHPDGKGKARFYECIGYTITNGEQLQADLLRLACTGVVTKKLKSHAGHKYVVAGSINAPNGRTYQLLTVWVIEPPDNEPRLVTAYPNNEQP